MLSCGISYRIVLCHVVLCCVRRLVLYCVVSYHILLCCAVLCCDVLCIIFCCVASFVLYCVVLCQFCCVVLCFVNDHKIAYQAVIVTLKFSITKLEAKQCRSNFSTMTKLISVGIDEVTTRIM